MRLVHLIACAGLLLGGSAVSWGQEVSDDEITQDQTQALVVVQKPPMTNIETFEQAPGVLITKGLSRVGNLVGDDNAELNLNVVYMKNSNDKKIYGVQVEVAMKDSRPVRCYIDEEEISPLIDALGKLSQVNKNSLPMELVEGAYKTKACMEILNRDLNGGRMAVIRVTTISPITGQVRYARAIFRASRLVEIIQQLNNAKGVINRLKD